MIPKSGYRFSDKIMLKQDSWTPPILLRRVESSRRASPRKACTGILHAGLARRAAGFRGASMDSANTSSARPAVLGLDELVRLLKADFPQIFRLQGYSIEEISYGGCRIRRTFHDDLLRPGGTISGPTLMEMGDFAIYVAVLASIGWKPLAVTTNLTAHFLRKTAAARTAGRMQITQDRQAVSGSGDNDPE